MTLVQDRNIVITGAAGEGVQTLGDLVAESLLAHGYPVFVTQEFESRIRGGMASVRLRVCDSIRNAPRHDADVLISLNPDAARHYRPMLRPDGRLLAPDEEGDAIVVPFKKLAEQAGGTAQMANSVAAGAILSLLGVPTAPLEALLTERFDKKGGDVATANVAAARAGVDAVPREVRSSTLPPRDERYLFLSGHDTIPLAAAAAGCRFMSAYPMSPSTGIITAFAADESLGVLVEQAEDEIAAINMAIGASFAGARAMTATSGGGFALMTEAVSLAGMTETPVVIVIAQRPGPATGLPTRTAQEDLLFAIHAGHGEFPKAVLAPSDPQDAYDKMVRAFDLAERFQIPVVVLTDQYLADSRFSLAQIDTSAQSRPSLADPEEFEENAYRRYHLGFNGISPRLIPGQSRHLVCADSDEHTESGHITEDLAGVRPAMVTKRREKLAALQREIASPHADRVDDADIILIGWGSTAGAIREATDLLRERKQRVGHLHFSELWPLPEFSLPRDRRIIVVEGNATGQLRRLLRGITGMSDAETISRSDGLPIEAADILREVNPHV